MAGRKDESVSFGAFEIDLSTREVRRDGIRVKLQDQPFAALALLLERPGELVTREKFRERIWGAETYVDFDQGLNKAIKQIRRVLGDSAEEPVYIETLPKRGYRFIAPLRPGHEVEAEPRETFVPPRGAWPTRLALIAGAIAAFLLLLFLTRHSWQIKTPRPNELLEVRSIASMTTEPAMAYDPAVSPDGTQLAYSWNGQDGIEHIYVKSLTEQQSLSLTRSKNPDRYPVWSPGGKEIVFARFLSQADAEIIRIPASGGSETAIRQVKWASFVQANGSMLAWTANGQWLCFSDRTPSGLFLFSLTTGVVKSLHSAGSNWNESSPAFSPDGHLVAFVRFYGPYNTQIDIQKLNDAQQTTGEPVEVSGTAGNPSSPVWLKDGRLVFLDRGNLMQASFSKPAAHQFYASNSDLQGLTYDSAQARLITSRSLRDGDIWSLPLKEKTAAGDPKRLVRSTANEGQPAFSPDGKWLAFVSDRSGADEVWLTDADGHNPRQLTRLSAYLIGFPHWSADSRFIVFHARVPKTPQIYLLRLEDNSLRKLTDGEPGFFAPSFSSDGKSVYCSQLSAATTKLHKLAMEGGSRQPLWEGDAPREAPGRNTLLYLKAGYPGIYERLLSGDPERNPETRLVPDSVPVQALCVTSNGIFYTNLSRLGSRGEIRFYSFAARQTSFIAPTEPGATVSLKSDGTSLAYDGGAEADSQLIEIRLK